MSVIWRECYKGGRIVAFLGRVEVGAVFPGTPWTWRFWLGQSAYINKTGKSKSELAAKGEVIAVVNDWLRLADLKMLDKGASDAP